MVVTFWLLVAFIYFFNLSFLIYFLTKCIYFNWSLITLQYCIGFAIHQHESATGIHVLPILNTPPSSLPIPSLWVIPVHQPLASSIFCMCLICRVYLSWHKAYSNDHSFLTPRKAMIFVINDEYILSTLLRR